MKLEITVNIQGLSGLFDLGVEIARQVFSLKQQVGAVMATQAELTKQVQDMTAQLKKSQGEIAGVQTEVNALKQTVADLEVALANGSAVTPELQTAFDELKAQVQVVDDAIPDAPTDQPTP